MATGFVQIIELRTKRLDEITALVDEYEKTTGRRASQRSIVGRDRNDPDRHVVVVEFDSYESAMQNSNLPETQAMSEKMAKLCEGPPTFTDLDVVEERSG